jgi:hypothetical protein
MDNYGLNSHIMAWFLPLLFYGSLWKPLQIIYLPWDRLAYKIFTF